jgi:N-acetylmuramoyl-L-alanine amidase
MNFVARILLVTALVLAAEPPRTQAWALRKPQTSGRDYVRVEDWARANQLQLHWLSDKTLQLSNRLARLVLTANSSDAQINGVAVRLSFPVGFQNGGIAMSQLDLDKAFVPVLYPPVNKTGTKINTICVDAGHGGKDTGEHSGSIEEKKYTLLLAKELQDQLSRAGFKVVMTRNADSSLELSDRTEIARRRKADLFIALHYNSSPSDRNEVRGIETYCLTPAGASSSNANGETGDTRWLKANGNDEKNMQLAYQLQKSLVRELAVEDRSVKRARFQVLREATMPAVLIEGGFLSHPTEQKRILDSAYRRQMARAIVDGIIAYKNSVKG